MIIIGRKKKAEEAKKGRSFEELQGFSEELIKLGREIEDKLAEKGKIEEEVLEKGKKAGKLRAEIFQLKGRLVRLNLALLDLEKKMKEVEDNQL